MAKFDKIAKQGAPRARKIANFAGGPPRVVGAAHTIAGLQMLSKLQETDLDIVEIRVDALLAAGLSEARIESEIGRARHPLLVTVRHPAEGGLGNLSGARRSELFIRFLPFAALMDIELRSLERMGPILRAARTRGIPIIVSDHHFRSIPTFRRMLERERQALRAGGNIFKLAALAKDAAAFGRLLRFCSRPGVRSVMGMGTFGKASRLALAKAGSVLNYGYLDRSNAPGQWEARELKQLVSVL